MEPILHESRVFVVKVPFLWQELEPKILSEPPAGTYVAVTDQPTRILEDPSTVGWVLGCNRY